MDHRIPVITTFRALYGRENDATRKREEREREMLGKEGETKKGIYRERDGESRLTKKKGGRREMERKEESKRRGTTKRKKNKEARKRDRRG